MALHSKNKNRLVRLPARQRFWGNALERQRDVRITDIKLESGFGIGNVNKRIRLYYGKPYGLSVQSEYTTGTCVTLVIPAKVERTPQIQDAVVGPEPESLSSL